MSYYFKYCLTHITLRVSHKYTWSDVLPTLSPHLNPSNRGEFGLMCYTLNSITIKSFGRLIQIHLSRDLENLCQGTLKQF